ncbi:PREDICTED: F-box/FBD/LRR-repeat protein At1g13570-like [Ipomoea nil]|uniref:F-box/FBD/LRR-repeat protein At1g13570-like n=1 Tax=Ipomoea nil TaxID=35883 RepID=UPI000901061F|nr:PREDICTED: F-box/FBD/LRR-repeat protein At1g13570-like [Ipomoea nil]
MAPGRDRISQLPADILDHILGFLPIEDAAKTVVLSSIWRDVWLSLTQLNFDRRFFRYINNKHRRASNYVKKSAASLYVINKVLRLHKGTIRKFVLCFYNVGKLAIRYRSYDIDEWLLLVTQKGVEEIYIGFAEQAYRLPGCIFSCLTLKRLHLYRVIVDPINFPCILPNVASLCFQWVDFGPINCLDCAIDVPALENLSFIDCKDSFYFDITAPKLCSLTIKSNSYNMLAKFLPVNLDLRSISTLDLNGFVQGFVKEFTRKGFRLNVKYLKLSRFEEFYTQSDRSSSLLAHVLRLCPKLRKLVINLFGLNSVATERMDAFLELHVVSQTNKKLHALKFIPFKGSHSETFFIKKLLASFSTLEKVVIVRDKYHCKKDSTGIMQELLDLPFASTKTKIIIV